MAQRHLPALLIIMDGCGLAPADGENAVAAAKTPFLDSLYEKYPHTTLGASGEDVGLPDGQMGNSEVGHLNIGAGRIVFQELSRINNAIKDGSIAKNEVFVKAMDDVKADGKTLHLMGLMSPGGVHSHMNHVEALVKMAAQHGVKTVRVHAFMDGRDVDPQSGAGYMSEFCAFLAKISEETGCDARVATVSGRYWAMDRDNRWERIQRAYDVMAVSYTHLDVYKRQSSSSVAFAMRFRMPWRSFATCASAILICRCVIWGRWLTLPCRSQPSTIVFYGLKSSLKQTGSLK